MKKYLGVKIVQAEPALKGWNQEESKQLSVEALQEGYKVVYEDGYVSWSPKDVFEKAYRLATSFDGDINIEVNVNTGAWGFPILKTGKDFSRESSKEDLKRFCVDQASRIAAYKGKDPLEIAQEIFKWIIE